MVLWQTEIRPSWRAQWLSLLLHGSVLLALWSAPWPHRYTLVWITLLVLVVMEAARSHRRIRSRNGEIALLTERRLRWREQQWRIIHRPWLGQQAIFLTLRGEQRQRAHLWLLCDSMTGREWRQLRQYLLNETDTR